MKGPTEAILLVGGLGTRLRSVVQDLPKPLAPVAGRPFLLWLIEMLGDAGVTRVILATGYLGEKVRNVVGSRFGGLDIDYSVESSPLGTGGAVWQAMQQCRSERVLIANGDSWLNASLVDMMKFHPRCDLVMAVRRVPDRSRYGSVRIGSDDRVLGMEEKGCRGEGLINAGVYIARVDLPRRRVMTGAFNLETEILARPRELDIRAFATDAPFIDIGTPDDYEASQRLIPDWAVSQRSGSGEGEGS